MVEPVRIEGAKVLVVDDLPANVLLLTELLEAEGYTVSAATSAEQCLKTAALDLPDLILLDIVMPGMDGFEVCRRLKLLQTTRDIPVIFISARGETRDVLEGFRLGAVDYIGKPIRQEEVCARVRTHLQLRSLIRERDQLIELLREQNSEIRRLSDLDPLTKLANLQTFRNALDRELRRPGEPSRPLSLLFIDIDYFNAFNEAYGHKAGDRCLQAVAHCVQGVLSHPGDLACRHGGEEFVLMLPGLRADEATHLAERLRHEVEALQIPHGQPPAGPVVTVSVGVTTWVPGPPRPTVTQGDLVRMADQALSHAKQGGRNQSYFLDFVPPAG